MSALQRFATVNPRIAAGMTPEQWERKRRFERRRAWEARAAQHDVAKAPTRERAAIVAVSVERNTEAARWREGGCLDPRVPLGESLATSNVEQGVSARAYYHAKFLRTGELGRFSGFNAFRGLMPEWEREATRHAKS